MSPSNGTVTRGCRLKPSSSLRWVRSRQSDTRTLQSGDRRFTRRPVLCASSATVNMSVGKIPPSGLSRPNRTWALLLFLSGNGFGVSTSPRPESSKRRVRKSSARADQSHKTKPKARGTRAAHNSNRADDGKCGWCYDELSICPHGQPPQKPCMALRCQRSCPVQAIPPTPKSR
jgi:hypothetical protein